MVRDAEAHSEEDRARKEEVEARNSLDNLIYGTEKTLNEGRGKLSAEAIRETEEVLARAKESLKGGNAGRMRAAGDELTKASHKMAEDLYGKAQGTSGGCGGNCAGSGQERPMDDAIDVEYEDARKSA